MLSVVFQEGRASDGCDIDPRWIYDMHAWTNDRGPHSQGSQDRYLEKIFSVIRTTNRYFVEFGFNVPDYDVQGSGPNTKKLYNDGWRGLLLDATNENAKINLKKHFLYANNIATIFAENLVPKDLDYLSCDMDSHDLWVFRSILDAGYRPRVITTEFNSNYPITDSITLLDPTIVGNSKGPLASKFEFAQCAWGAGAGALRLVAEAHGYTMIGRVGHLDLIWLRNDLLLQACFQLPPFEWFFRDAAIGRLHHSAQSASNILSRLVDYATFLRTGGNITASNRAARDILKTRSLACFDPIKEYL